MCFTSIYCDNITHIQYNVYVCLCARPAVFTWVWWLSMCLCREAELDEFDLLWLSSSNNPAHTISKPISQSANIWPEVLPHTGTYRLKDTSLFKHKQLAEGLRFFFPQNIFQTHCGQSFFFFFRTFILCDVSFFVTPSSPLAFLSSLPVQCYFRNLQDEIMSLCDYVVIF